MKPLKPRALTPADGLLWLKRALDLLLLRPWLFIGIALIAPLGSAALLALPFWHGSALSNTLWLLILITLSCYGLPLAWAISLGCGFARAVNRHQTLQWRQLLLPGLLRVFSHAALFLFVLLLQGYLAMYLVEQLIHPTASAISVFTAYSPMLIVTDTLLGTQLGMIGVLVLVLQFLLAMFVTPLYLFHELPLIVCWRYSVLALHLNPWLVPVLGLSGIVLVALALLKPFTTIAQIIALPLPAYLGVLLYVAWLEVFQGGQEERLPESVTAHHKMARRVSRAVPSNVSVNNVSTKCQDAKKGGLIVKPP